MFDKLLKQLGAWTTVYKWREPAFYRVRLKGDLLARLFMAFATGAIATSVLLVLFAVNTRPPSPLYALTGMLIVGGPTLMVLVNGKRTSRGYVRVCEEGIIYKRTYAGLSSQWVAEVSWPYPSISHCTIVPSSVTERSFTLLLVTDESGAEMLAVPPRINPAHLAGFLSAKGVTLYPGNAVPEAFRRPMPGLPAFLLGTVGLVILLSSAGFYALQVPGKPEQQRAEAGELNPADRPPGPPRVGLPSLPPAFDRAPLSEPLANPVLPPPIEFPAPDAAVDFGAPPALPNGAPQLPDFGTPPPVQPEFVRPSAPSPPLVPGASLPADATDAPSPEAGPLTKEHPIGGSGGFPFETVDRQGRPVVGFRWILGSWGGRGALSQLHPIYERSPVSGDRQAIAREGYVVGGLQVSAQEFVHAIRIIFVRVDEHGRLQKNDYYFSEWVGEKGEPSPTTSGNGEDPVVGIHGRRGAVIDALGVILRDE